MQVLKTQDQCKHLENAGSKKALRNTGSMQALKTLGQWKHLKNAGSVQANKNAELLSDESPDEWLDSTLKLLISSLFHIYKHCSYTQENSFKL